MENKIFNYSPIIDGKINDVPIGKIVVGWCDICDNRIKLPCTTHHILIYDNNKNYLQKDCENARQRFSTAELMEKGYLDYVEYLADDDYFDYYKENCNLIKLIHPSKIFRVCAYGSCC